MTSTRRDFLSHAAAAAELPVLVVLQLSGGNDGLNTVVPWRDDAYRRARPGLALPEAPHTQYGR